MNVKKTKYLAFGLKSKTRKMGNHSLFIGNHKLEHVTSYKYLGMTLDMNLNYNKHINYKMIYKTMILPIIEYGNVIYDGASQKLLDNLQTIQNRKLCICIQRNRYTSTMLLHQLCNINKLKDRRVMHLFLFMYKQKGNISIVNTRNVRTRAHDAPLFTMKKPNNAEYERNVLYKGAL